MAEEKIRWVPSAIAAVLTASVIGVLIYGPMTRKKTQEVTLQETAPKPAEYSTLELETAWSEYASALGETSYALGRLDQACKGSKDWQESIECKVAWEAYDKIHGDSLSKINSLKHLTKYDPLVEKAIWFAPKYPR